jgi:hypothetical protein
MNLEEYVKTEDALFHYTKTSAAIEILDKKEFKLSTLYDTNDPREYKFKGFSYKRSSSAGDDCDCEKLSNKFDTEINRILLHKCRIMSFCSNPNLNDKDSHPDVWTKCRMWTQYGEGHRGVCLVLSKNEIKKAIDGIQTQVKACMADDIDYSSIIESHPVADLSPKVGNNNIEEQAFEHVKAHFKYFFFRKHTDYRDEAEFRVSIFDPDKKFERIDISKSLQGVIVGDRTYKPYIRLINQMCKDINIECRQAYWCTTSPDMVLKELKGAISL